MLAARAMRRHPPPSTLSACSTAGARTRARSAGSRHSETTTTESRSSGFRPWRVSVVCASSPWSGAKRRRPLRSREIKNCTSRLQRPQTPSKKTTLVDGGDFNNLPLRGRLIGAHLRGERHALSVGRKLNRESEHRNEHTPVIHFDAPEAACLAAESGGSGVCRHLGRGPVAAVRADSGEAMDPERDPASYK